jgi:Cys-tRNA(Pro) deacylase
MEPVARVRDALHTLGIEEEIIEFSESTATAAEAASAVGCELGQIVKTLFFLADGRPTVVLAAGDRQVDTARLAPLVGVGRKKLKMGTPEQVLEHTGYVLGGVSPFGMPNQYDVVVDDSLKRFERVWAAAGTPSAVVGLPTARLVEALNGQWGDVVRDQDAS